LSQILTSIRDFSDHTFLVGSSVGLADGVAVGEKVGCAKMNQVRFVHFKETHVINGSFE
jgi:hypothetical protein